MRVIALLLFGVLLLGCSKKSSPGPPEAASLVFPDKDSECTTGSDLNDTTSEIEFKWIAADHTDSYELRVTNLNTNITQTLNTSAVSAKLPIEKGEPFSWFVRSRNTEVSETASSNVWYFYNAGSVETHTPFPAQVVYPENGASLFKDVNNEVTLEWTGADVDGDITGYEIYFSTENPPVDLIATITSTNLEQVVSVSADTTYYWRVITRDGEGNSSQSGVFSFKAL
ncbi:fibronectin type III domain-containing protein [Maribacter luteus]|uniref:Fibronectin type-III domain-containing protein n=1 Tax=Maribacter luteus TaxID=2594478 RepID=A0A6I2MIW1_9FLAO|nr:hypothetical protein [Maribacter luteus]MRX63648.1 hypothetical protein [Maribacter luteus]